MMFRAPVFPFYFVILGIAASASRPPWCCGPGWPVARWLAAFRMRQRVEGLLQGSIPPPDHPGVWCPHFGGPAPASGSGPARGRGGPDRHRDVAGAQHPQAAIGSGGPRRPLRHVRALRAAAIVNAMIAGRGALAPVEREATVLADIAGFTDMTQRPAARTVEILNVYFDEATRSSARTTASSPSSRATPCSRRSTCRSRTRDTQRNAFNAACAILACVAEREFAGERIRVRIGINTASWWPATWAAADASYTARGHCQPCRSARGACKDHGTSLLVSAATAKALLQARLVAVGDIVVRGLAEPVTVFSISRLGLIARRSEATG